MAGAAVAGGIGAWIAWAYLLHDYQRQRILTFIDPTTDPQGAGYHSLQSLIAIGSGGLFGKGWMHGSQSQLAYLPERHTDFIFAVIGEEFGLFGITILMGLYLFVIARALYLSAQTQDTFARLLSSCLSLTFFVYVVHQHRHGQWPVAGGRRAAAAGQLRWYVDGDPAGRLRLSSWRCTRIANSSAPEKD